MLASNDPLVHQFFHGEPDGPSPFHYAGESYEKDLGLKATHG
jgi:phospholipid/cholesterol/gamma-HCH transport system ATP-binding protein